MLKRARIVIALTSLSFSGLIFGAGASIAAPATMEIGFGLAALTKQSITDNQKLASPPFARNRAKIAIVIDDLGYDMISAKRIAALPYPLTLAIIPNTPHATEISEMPTLSAHELILHVPMETLQSQYWEDGLNTSMPYQDIQTTLRAMLTANPRIKGINNHGGSKFTQDQQRMQWVMEVLQEKQLYMLDSKTTALSAVPAAANAHQVAVAVRDVFLDNSQEKEKIRSQFNRLRKIALRHGQAIAIGHPHLATIEVLEEELPALVAQGFELRLCSSLTKASVVFGNKNKVALETNKRVD